jgi:hypothetical protein
MNHHASLPKLARASKIACFGVALGLLLEGCGDSAQDRAAAAMRADLAAAARRLETSSVIFGVGRLADELAALPSDSNQRRHLALGLRTARAELYAGRPEAAAERAEELLALARTAGLGEAERACLRLATVARLRQAEVDNCVDGHNPESCLLPLQGGGVHRRPEAARRAQQHLTRWLAAEPESATAAWLANVTAMALGEWPAAVPENLRMPAHLVATDAPVPRLTNVAEAAGISGMGLAGSVVVEDFDGDGLLDVLTSTWGPRGGLRFWAGDPAGGFVERTRDVGLEGLLGGLNLTHGDYDNDGDPDVLVLRGAWLGRDGRLPTSLLAWERDGFRDVTSEAGIRVDAPSQAGAFADFDLDGHLDLFVGYESGPGEVHPCRLWRNRGDGTFEDVSAATGADIVGFVKAAIWGDIDGDGDPDLYLSRLGEPNSLLRNDLDADGRRHFRDIAAAAGVTEPIASFPAAFFDADDDGDLDLFVSAFTRDFLGEELEGLLQALLGRTTVPEDLRPRFYRNRGDGTFDETGLSAGLLDPILGMAVNVGDLDGDGRLDLYVGTGAPDYAALVPNVLMQNLGDGHFRDVSASAGVGHLQKGHGIALGDLDGDGDEDLFAVLGGAWPGDTYADALFESTANPAAWIGLELQGTRSNRSAIGAEIEIVLPTRPSRAIRRTVGVGGSFGSSSHSQTISLPSTEPIDVTVSWPGGGAQSFAALVPNRRWRLVEGASAAHQLERRPRSLAGSRRDHHH